MSFDQIKSAVIVIMACVTAVTAILGLVAALRKERSYHNEPLVKVNERLDRHERKIEQLEADRDALKRHNDDQDEQNAIVIRSLLAILRHMQYGNNVDGMKRSESEITDWLTRRGA